MTVYYAARGDRGEVTCDGRPLSDVIWVDTEAGRAKVARRNDQGKVFVEHGDIATEIVHGQMVFTPEAR